MRGIHVANLENGGPVARVHVALLVGHRVETVRSVFRAEIVVLHVTIECLKHHVVKTKADLGWFVYLRLYGPEQAAFDGTWRPGDFELMEQTPR